MYLPREYSRKTWHFLARGGLISVEVSGHRRHCKGRFPDIQLLKKGNIKPINMNKDGSFRRCQTRKNKRTVVYFREVLIILLHRSIQIVKCLLKIVNLCKCTALSSDVLADKPHPRFDTKILSKKVRFIRRFYGISLFSYFRTYCINVSHAIQDDIKHFQQAEPEHYFDFTNWRRKICIWRLFFSS